MILNRHLAAIMFTDLVGYSKLMASDEDMALELLEKSRGIHQEAILRNNGLLQKEMGDGILASFPTALDAVCCANQIMKRLESLDKLKLRIGVHVGEIIEKSSDIFGTGVNIAARIVNKARAGQILVTETAFHTIRNMEGTCFQFQGNTRLKNIPGLFGIYSVRNSSESSSKASSNRPRFQRPANPGAFVALTTIIPLVFVLYFRLAPIDQPGAHGQLQEEARIAIMPFRSLDEKLESYQFAEGLFEDLQTAMYKANKLNVSFEGKTAIDKRRARNFSIEKFAIKAGIRYIVVGSVRTNGDAVRINVQVLDMETGRPIWMEKFDRSLNDQLQIQREVSSIILVATLEKLQLIGPLASMN